MKKYLLIISILILTGCTKKTLFFRGSVGVFPDNQKKFWSLIQFPDYRFVENAKVLLDSTIGVPFSKDAGGYYKEGISELTYDSEHTIEVKAEDNENIYGSVEIPSFFTINSQAKGESLLVQWTPADSIATSPDRWLVIVTQNQDTLYQKTFSNTESKVKLFPIISFDNIEVTIDAIRYGDLKGARGGSVFAGVVQKRKNIKTY